MSSKNVKKNATSLDCIIVGDVLWDIIIDSRSIDGIVEGGAVYTEEAIITPGGSGNVACGIAALGGKAAFIGKAGKDVLGELYRKDLENYGVKSKIFQDKTMNTGFTIVFLGENKQRSFIVFRGANNNLSPEEIQDQTSVLRKTKYVYVSGFSLVKRPQSSAIMEAVNIAKNFGAKIAFDPGAYNLVNAREKTFQRLVDSCDVLIANMDEAEAITKSENLDDVIEKLRSLKPDLIALKRGKRGAIMVTKDKLIRAPAYKARRVDTTGVGDAFAAATIYGLSRGFPIDKTGELSNWFASKVVSTLGSRAKIQKSEIEDYFKRFKS